MVATSPSLILKWTAVAAVSLICSTDVMGFSAPRHHHNSPRLRVRETISSRVNSNSISSINGQLWMSGKKDSGENDNNDDDFIKDPNPGGLNQWAEEDDDNKRSFQDLNFIEQIQEWFSSPEGKEDVKTYIISLGIALLLRLLIIEPRYIPSLSMYPTFEVGDQLAVEKVTKRIRPFSRREVVVFNPPETFRELVGDSSRKAKEALIKRIVAVEVSLLLMSMKSSIPSYYL